jgi:hypothetical protein
MSGFSNPLVGGGGALVYPSIHSPNYPAIPSWSINKDGSASFSGSVTSGGTITGANMAFSNGYLSNGDGTFSSTPGLLLYSSNPPAANNLLLSDCPSLGVDKFGNIILPGFTIYGPTSAIQFFSTGTVYNTGTQTGGWSSGNQQLSFTSTNTNVGGTNVNLQAQTLIKMFIGGIGQAQLTNAGLEVLTSMIFDAQIATPNSNAGNSVVSCNPAGEMVTIDGGDGTTYVMQRRTVDLTADSGAISSSTPASVGLSSAVGSLSGARKYRFHARLYITTTSTPQFGFKLVVPGTATGLIGGSIYRAATFVGSVQAAPNTAAAIAIALSGAVTYMVDLDGMFTTDAASGNVNLNVFDNTGGVGSFTVNQFSYIEISPM